MDARWIGFGEIELEGKRYDHDVVIDGGEVTKRAKKPSQPYREKYGHTPLSGEERIPWGGKRLIVGSGAYGKLPVMPEVAVEARRRGVKVVEKPTKEALQLVHDSPAEDVYAIVHVTC